MTAAERQRRRLEKERQAAPKVPLPKFCIFCGGRPLSSEHVWGKRMRKHLDLVWPRTEHVVTAVNADGTKSQGHGRFNRPGDPVSQTLRVVCKDCNEGWMSRPQEGTLPDVAKLVAGDWSNIDRDGWDRVSRLIVLTVMVLEFVDPGHVGITESERAAFRGNQLVPPGWNILCGRCDGIYNGVFNHFAGVDFMSGYGLDVLSIGKFQTAGFMLGKLLVQTFSSNSYDFSYIAKGIADTYDLRIVSPYPGAVSMPATVHTYWSFDMISGHFSRSAGFPTQSFVGKG